MTEEKQHFNKENIDYRNEMSKLTLEINLGLKRRIIMAAGQSDLSISEYVSHVLEEAVPDEEVMQQELHPVGSDLLEEVYKFRERIMRESGGHLFEDSVEVIRRMREERSRHLEQVLRGDTE